MNNRIQKLVELWKEGEPQFRESLKRAPAATRFMVEPLLALIDVESIICKVDSERWIVLPYLRTIVGILEDEDEDEDESVGD